MAEKPVVYCLMGPTACGKTELALWLAEQVPIEIISVDSAMVYRGMNIGTAKPSEDILATVPHHLIDIREPNQPYSAADFCADAKKIIASVLHRGKVPLLVGGTMLYFKALQQGLSELPSASPMIREELLQKAKMMGWEKMYQELQTLDPVAAKNIHPHDPQRIQRALEVYYLTGEPLSEHFKKAKSESLFQYCSIGLFPSDRQFLHQRIEQRFHEMLHLGWVKEVQMLMQHYSLELCSPALRMVGYRQVALYLEQKLTKQEMISQGIIATRQLAKRQMTWLRHWPDISLIEPWPIQEARDYCLRVTSFPLYNIKGG